MRRVAVTGMGIVSPIGTGTEVFWQNLLEGKCGIAPIKISGPKLSGNALWAAVADDFLDRSPIPPGALRNTDRFTQFAMAATSEAFRQARLDPPAERTAVVVGNTMGGFPLVAQITDRGVRVGGRLPDGLGLREGGGREIRLEAALGHRPVRDAPELIPIRRAGSVHPLILTEPARDRRLLRCRLPLGAADPGSPPACSPSSTPEASSSSAPGNSSNTTPPPTRWIGFRRSLITGCGCSAASR